jgi:hypothetical protein
MAYGLLFEERILGSLEAANGMMAYSYEHVVVDDDCKYGYESLVLAWDIG